MRVQLEKGGVLGAGQVKRGVFTPAHTFTEHICEHPPPPPRPQSSPDKSSHPCYHNSTQLNGKRPLCIVIKLKVCLHNAMLFGWGRLPHLGHWRDPVLPRANCLPLQVQTGPRETGHRMQPRTQSGMIRSFPG